MIEIDALRTRLSASEAIFDEKEGLKAQNETLLARLRHHENHQQQQQQPQGPATATGYTLNVEQNRCHVLPPPESPEALRRPGQSVGVQSSPSVRGDVDACGLETVEEGASRGGFLDEASPVRARRALLQLDSQNEMIDVLNERIEELQGALAMQNSIEQPVSVCAPVCVRETDTYFVLVCVLHKITHVTNQTRSSSRSF